MKYEIPSKQAYHETMLAIYQLMNKGEANLAPEELEKLAAMTSAAEQFEDEVLDLKPKKDPDTITEAVELKLFENKMSQARLAQEMGIAKSKVSEVLSGKRKADVSFLKGLHRILHIDADFLLEHA